MYIGQSGSITARWKVHKSLLKNGKHYNKHLQSDYNKFGEQEFEFIVLELCGNETRDDRESHWVGFHKSNSEEKGYNKDSGGSVGRVRNDSVRKIISAKAKKRGMPKETQEKGWAATRLKAKESHHFFGRKFSAEHVRKLSESKKGVLRGPHSEETRRKISAAQKGIPRGPLPEEQKRKIGAKQKGRIKSDEERKNISEARKGMKLSESHKRNLSLNHHNRKVVTEEMKADVLNGITFQSFKDKYNCIGPMNRIKKHIKLGTLSELR
jgi:hypothetical protein